MNARGNSLLLEEKERNKVNKALPRLEQELHDLIARWEQEQGREFLVGGTNFAAFIANQVRLRRLLGISLTFQFFRKKNICRVSRPRSWPGRRLRRKTYCTRPDSVQNLPPQPSLKVSPSPPKRVLFYKTCCSFKQHQDAEEDAAHAQVHLREVELLQIGLESGEP